MKANSLILIFFCFVLIGSDTPEVTKETWSMGIGTVINTAISTIGVIVVAWMGYKVAKLKSKVEDYHKEVNGKMGQLLEVTAKANKAEGKLEEKEETEAKEQKEGLK